MSNVRRDQIESLCARGCIEEAARIISQSVNADDPEGLYLLGLWRVAGTLINRDLKAAREALKRAANLGHTEATELYAALLATGMGGAPDWKTARMLIEALPLVPSKERQIALLEKMHLDPDGYPHHPPEKLKLSTSPEIFVCRNFLSDEECNYLTEISRNKLEPSLVVDPNSGHLIPHPIRNSDGVMLGIFDENLVVNAINRRIAVLTDTLIQQGEPLQILRYQPGGEYRMHMDAIVGADNQRIVTVLIYLNSDYDGGETHFTTGLSFKGRKGDALMFRNILKDQSPDPNSRHAGLCVRRGEKFLATRWIRQQQFNFPSPHPYLTNFVL